MHLRDQQFSVSYCQIQEVVKSHDPSNFDPAGFHFPIDDYIDINSDYVDTFTLGCYSQILQHMQEPVLYNNEDLKFLRIIHLEADTSTSYRLEWANANHYKLVVKKIGVNYLDSFNKQPKMIAEDSLILTAQEYNNIITPFIKSNIWTIKPHSNQPFSV